MTGSASTHKRPAISPELLDKTLTRVMAVPRRWVAITLVATAISAIDASFAPTAWSLTFHATVLTTAFLALLWLPPLLNVIALGGGGFKTAAGEATAVGLLEVLKAVSPDVQRDVIPKVIAAVSTGPDAEQPDARAFQTDLEEHLATLPVDTDRARKRLAAIGAEYEELRRTMPSGSARTFQMSQLVAEAFGLAPRVGRRPPPPDQFDKEPDGDRVVDLAAVQAAPRADHLSVVLRALQGSRSAFEQYQAIRALERLAPSLSAPGKATAAQALKAVLSGGGEHQITPDDASRWLLAARLLAALSA